MEKKKLVKRKKKASKPRTENTYRAIPSKILKPTSYLMAGYKNNKANLPNQW